jgi:hypothetical protein
MSTALTIKAKVRGRPSIARTANLGLEKFG